MVYAPLNNQTPTVEYNDSKDVVFFKEEVSETELKKGMFAIFFPTDLHMPGIVSSNSQKVKKLVIKVLAN